MPKYEKAIEFINKYQLMFNLWSNEEFERICRIIRCSCAEFLDLTEAEQIRFEVFTDYLDHLTMAGGTFRDEMYESELGIICAEKMLVLAPGEESNDRHAAWLLNTASEQNRLKKITKYKTYGDETEENEDKEVELVSYEMRGLFGPINYQFSEIWYDCAQMRKDGKAGEAEIAKAARDVCVASAIVLLLNLFVPSAAQVLTSVKLKWVYMLIFAGTVLVAPFGLDDAFKGITLILMLILGSLMFNMFPLYAAMKIQSVVVTALLCIACGLVFRTAKRKGVIEEQKNRRRQIRQKAKSTHQYVDKLIHTLQKETPMKSEGFETFDQERLKIYKTYIDRYCDLLRKGLKEMDSNVRKVA